MTRPDPVSLLTAQDADLLPGLVPLRRESLSRSSFAFFRGSGLLMAADLGARPTSGLRVQLNGDAHLSNFGIYEGPDRRLVFDLHDFDETSVGPWEWDVQRLAASLAIAGRDNGLSPPQRRRAVLRTARRYRTSMLRFATMSALSVWHVQADPGELRRRRRIAVAPAAREGRQQLTRLTEEVDGGRRFLADPPFLVPARDLPGDRDEATYRMRVFLDGYAHSLSSELGTLLDEYSFVDLARSVNRVDNLGRRSWLALLTDRTTREPLFLQVKEAQPSVLSRAGVLPPSDVPEAERIVSGQRLMQACTDPLLGWRRFDDEQDRPRTYYVRQLHDWHVSADVSRMGPRTMSGYGELCGWTLARAHARSGNRVALAGHLGDDSDFERTVADLAETCADQNEQDYQEYVAATAS